MQLRLSEEQERPLAPWALALAAITVGFVLNDLAYWLRSDQHKPVLAHPAWYGGALAFAWLWLAWACRTFWLRAAWLLLALDQVMTVVAFVDPGWTRWWVRDAFTLAWAVAIVLWSWRRSPRWTRVLFALLLLGSLEIGHLAVSPGERNTVVPVQRRSAAPARH